MAIETKLFETTLGGRKLIIETGKFAHQASGSVTVRYGDTVILAAATMSESTRDGIDFFPLLVDYEEKFYATGKISGSRFIKREGRPSEKATLTSRLIDRPLRPLFPYGMRNDVQIVTSVLSADGETDSDTTAIIAASAALSISGIPFNGPVAAVRIGMNAEDGSFIVNPTQEQVKSGLLDLVVAGTKDAIMMVEAGAKQVSEEKMLEAIELAHKEFAPAIDVQQQLVKALAPKQREFVMHEPGNEVRAGETKTLHDVLKEMVSDDSLDAALFSDSKSGRNEASKKLITSMQEQLASMEEYRPSSIASVIHNMVEERLRYHVLTSGKRPDGRGVTDIRPISCEVGFLPRTHGSAMFLRGETQALTVTTIASKGAGQIIETMDQDFTKYYMHHYNFPAYSVGEVRPMRSAGRREIGHGNLAERAIVPVLPAWEEFPYTLRVVSEILSSAGSTSMASVCGSTLSLMDAGVPILKPVSGIAMGLITGEKGEYKVLSDIRDVEDFGGDMDFKVAGTDTGITALQMDIKITGITVEIMRAALMQAKEGRQYILGKMLAVLDKPRSELSPYAPRVEVLRVRPDQIRQVIGSGGKVINEIIEVCTVDIDIDDDGLVQIYGTKKENVDKAIEWVKRVTYEFTLGDMFEGTVAKIQTDRNTGKEIGAIVELYPGVDGMVHISELAFEHVPSVSSVCKVGDKIKVKVVDVDAERGRVSLSRKAVLAAELGIEPPPRPDKDRRPRYTGGR